MTVIKAGLQSFHCLIFWSKIENKHSFFFNIELCVGGWVSPGGGNLAQPGALPAQDPAKQITILLKKVTPLFDLIKIPNFKTLHCQYSETFEG